MKPWHPGFTIAAIAGFALGIAATLLVIRAAPPSEDLQALQNQNRKLREMLGAMEPNRPEAPAAPKPLDLKPEPPQPAAPSDESGVDDLFGNLKKEGDGIQLPASEEGPAEPFLEPIQEPRQRGG